MFLNLSYRNKRGCWDFDGIFRLGFSPTQCFLPLFFQLFTILRIFTPLLAWRGSFMSRLRLHKILWYLFAKRQCDLIGNACNSIIDYRFIKDLLFRHLTRSFSVTI